MNEYDDTRFMRMALREAQEAARQGEIPIGAVIVSNGMVVGRGHNLTETSAMSPPTPKFRR